ncbi:dienelactone hydrolase family protein [Paenibacillus sp. PL91]|uniref:dienelactone hydrolase family protein n=1 Tax=Paenibacillus sp. PL91 TaxID=2729538 RepID=UPI00145F36C0|nr:dienelactone hydrolase family protein [Paenibacillus sp. PL91]MBC9200868.1 dienelactone hydrolase family protein [Paenibacillus sp. PL91]
MIKINKNSDTVIIVIHEIYGVNKHMNYICESLSDRHFDIICPNLLDRELPFDYAHEEAAYRHFMEHVGFTQASHQIISLVLGLKDKYQKIFIAGFSVGATIAWLCSEEKNIDGIVGYYGSRIRNYVDLSPQCPALLFFPQEEPAFEVDELISSLVEKDIEAYKCSGQHGFSDPYSTKYHAKSAQQTFQAMIDFFQSV